MLLSEDVIDACFPFLCDVRIYADSKSQIPFGSVDGLVTEISGKNRQSDIQILAAVDQLLESPYSECVPEVMDPWAFVVTNVWNAGVIQELPVKIVKQPQTKPMPVAAGKDIVIVRQLIEAPICIPV